MNETPPMKRSVDWSDWFVTGLGAVTQSLIVGLWFFKTLSAVAPDLPFAWRVAFSVIAGTALDVTVIKTTTGDLDKGTGWTFGGWAWWTPFIAFLFSSAIAYDFFSHGTWDKVDRGGVLHTGFATVVFVSSQYIAQLRRQRLVQKNVPSTAPIVDTPALFAPKPFPMWTTTKTTTTWPVDSADNGTKQPVDTPVAMDTVLGHEVDLSVLSMDNTTIVDTPATTVQGITGHLRTLLGQHPDMSDDEIETQTGWNKKDFRRQAMRVRNAFQKRVHQ